MINGKMMFAALIGTVVVRPEEIDEYSYYYVWMNTVEKLNVTRITPTQLGEYCDD